MVVSELLASLGFEVDEKPLDHISEQLEGVKRRLEFLAAAEVIRGVYELTERFSHFAENLGVAATSAGVTVEALQKLQFAAGQSGVSADEVTGSLSRLSRVLYEAQQGSVEAKKAFEQAGIPDAAVMSYQTSTQALEGIGDALRGIDNPIKRQAIAMQLLGRSAGNMVEFLATGSKAMREAGASAEAMGAVVSGRDITALREVEDTLSALWQVVKSFSASVAALFAPNVKYAANAIMKFYAANKQLLMANITRWVDDGMYALGFLFGVVRTLIAAFLAFAASHSTLIERAGRLALILGGLGLAAGALNTVLGTVKSVADTLGGGFGALGGTVKIGWQALTLFKNGLVLILSYAGQAIATVFPALGRAVLAVATALNAPLGIIAGITAAIAALVLGAQAAYVVFFKHGKFEDTWMGQLFAKAKDVGKTAMSLFGFGDDAKDDSKKTASMGQGDASLMMRNAGEAVRDTQALVGANSVLAPGAQNLAELATATTTMPPMPPGVAAAMPQDAVVQAAMGPQNYTVQAPITINVPAGTDGTNVAQKVKQGVQEHLDKVLRETRRSIRTTQVH